MIKKKTNSIKNKINKKNIKNTNKKMKKKNKCKKGKSCGLACIPKKHICRIGLNKSKNNKKSNSNNKKNNNKPSQIPNYIYYLSNNNFKKLNNKNYNNDCIDSSNCKYGEKCQGSKCVEDDKTYILPW